MMFCTNCGATLPDQAKFCNRCGQAVQVALRPLCLACGAPLADRSAPCASCGARHRTCTKCGRLLPVSALVCTGCAALLDTAPAYALAAEEFEHPAMQQVNQTLRQSIILNQMAESISARVGKPWYESCFNSVQVTDKQYAKLGELAAIAARRIGFARVPSVYIEADRGYQSNTYGSEADAFVNVGMFLPKLLADRELLFILGHEFGHLLCRHALWMTVSLFLCGQSRSNIMSEGLLALLSNPLKILESGVESMIMNWMRVADLTADRAALLVCGDISVARRTLFLLYFKSRRELEEVDVEAWARQQENQDAAMAEVSQIMTSATPYLGLRLRALGEFYASPRYGQLRDKVEAGCGLALADLFDAKGALAKYAKPAKPAPAATNRAPPDGGTAVKAVRRKVKVVEGACPKCGRRFARPLEALPDGQVVELRCQGCRAKFKINLGGLRLPAAVEPRSLPPDTEESS
ncbi:MAG: zinc-ribbon domain-containing protein [Thiobacillus sp.]|nr:zinc-ribbon domain-containing protein [Thiobacillus sp.]